MSRVPPDLQAEMVRMYNEEHLSCGQIADRTFWSKTSVLNVMHMHGVQFRAQRDNKVRQRTRLSDDAIAHTVELYQTGLSIRDVASALGIARTTVRHRLLVAGVEMRANSNAVSLRRRRRLQRGGPDAFTQLQRTVLAQIAEHGEIATPKLARNIGKTNQQARDILYKLRTLGYVTARPTHAGRNHPFVWSLAHVDPDAMVQNMLSPATHYGKTSDEEMLPVEPFRAWLEEWIAREERRAMFAGEIANVAVTTKIARRLGMTDRRLWAIRYEQPRIALATADRYLTKAGTVTRLEDLWPELDHTEVAA